MNDIEGEDVVIPSRGAARILARAAAIDAASSHGPSIAQLRSAALDTGIRPAAFDAALLEVSASGLAELVRPTPWWVRMCMTGITDRRGAMVFYWIFVIMLFLAPVVAVLLPRGVSSGPRLAVSLLGAGFAFFSLWSTSRAVRWLDHHGWQRLK